MNRAFLMAVLASALGYAVYDKVLKGLLEQAGI